MTDSLPVSLETTERYRSSSLWLEALRNLLHNPSAILGMGIIGLLLLTAVAAPLIATHDPIKTMIGVPGETGRLPSKPPCIPVFGCEEPMHILGLDLNARDLFSRVIFGTRTSLSVGIITISLSIIVGTTLGITSGYAGGKVDNVIMRIMDVVLAFPALLLGDIHRHDTGSGFNQCPAGHHHHLHSPICAPVAGQRLVDQRAGICGCRTVRSAPILCGLCWRIFCQTRSHRLLCRVLWVSEQPSLTRLRSRFSVWAHNRQHRNGDRS